MSDDNYGTIMRRAQDAANALVTHLEDYEDNAPMDTDWNRLGDLVCEANMLKSRLEYFAKPKGRLVRNDK